MADSKRKEHPTGAGERGGKRSKVSFFSLLALYIHCLLSISWIEISFMFCVFLIGIL